MLSSLTNACKIRTHGFEGPFDLLFHLIERQQINIWDIPISDITDQYMDYLFAMKELDMEIASEFLVMAATLLHIKSRMLLPYKKEKREEEEDPREELIIRLIEYKKYKELAQVLKRRETEWGKVFYKPPESIEYKREDEFLSLSGEELRRIYRELLIRNDAKTNRHVAGDMTQIVRRDRVSVKSKMKEIVRMLLERTFFRFSELFSLKSKSKAEVAAGFLAVLELVKLKKIKIRQKKLFSDIIVYKAQNSAEDA